MPLSSTEALALALDPSLLLQRAGITPDPWQRSVLLSADKQVLLNCSRQSGKSTTVSALALHTALFQPGSLTLLLSPSQRQSIELFRKVMQLYSAIGRPVKLISDSQTKAELANGSRIVCLPGREETIRSFSGVKLLIIDEAARVPDDLYRSVRPMLAVSEGGRLVCLSTPFGQRGFFYHEWDAGQGWKKVRITWKDCPRITAEFIAGELRSLGDSWVRQEFECSFEAMEGLVYPDFDALGGWDCTGEGIAGRLVGGIDFGFRNPFAALWGVLDRDDVLWLYGERYLRETPLHEHAAVLPKNVTWYADPAGRTEIEELRHAGLTVRRGKNDIKAGIAAVASRLRTKRLRVYRFGCPNLFAEAKLYRYPTLKDNAAVTEVPIDDNNHSLAALRYLISRVDATFIAKFRRQHGRPTLDALEVDPDVTETLEAVYRAKVNKPWLRVDNEALWDN